ncbi:MAG: alpha/beta fold hydrolase [Bryobacteraceae bacterium]|nr:alpha/beta fold hydrolase [Bryobacteraceae bacterium]MDW8379928.1 alpha/beta fold hydrolase [Bryobacterales bacterium]
MTDVRGMDAEQIERLDHPNLQGFLHRPSRPRGDGVVLAHGAGSSCQAPLLVSLASAFAQAGFAALRINLPFRRERPGGPPRPGDAARDREGLYHAVQQLRAQGLAQVIVGGHSYGARQATLLAAEDPYLASRLLLLSYPLHPPRKPNQLRSLHFPQLKTPSLFVHGDRDPFATVEELRTAIETIPARTEVLVIPGAGHGLQALFRGRSSSLLPAMIDRLEGLSISSTAGAQQAASTLPS